MMNNYLETIFENKGITKYDILCEIQLIDYEYLNNERVNYCLAYNKKENVAYLINMRSNELSIVQQAKSYFKVDGLILNLNYQKRKNVFTLENTRAKEVEQLKKYFK